MNETERIRILLKEITGPVVAYHGGYRKILGGVKVALLFSQLEYLDRIFDSKKNERGEFFQNLSVLQDILGYTPEEATKAKKQLVSLGVVSCRYCGLTRKTFWKVKYKRLAELCEDFLEKSTQTKGNSDSAKPGIAIRRNAESRFRKTGHHIKNSNENIRSLPNGRSPASPAHLKRTRFVSSNGVNGNHNPVESHKLQRRRQRRRARKENPCRDLFEKFLSVYPPRLGHDPIPMAEGNWNQLIRKKKIDPELLIERAKWYAKFEKKKGNIGTGYVMQASSFLGPRKAGWMTDWRTMYKLLKATGGANGNGKPEVRFGAKREGPEYHDDAVIHNKKGVLYRREEED